MEGAFENTLPAPEQWGYLNRIGEESFVLFEFSSAARSEWGWNSYSFL